MPRRRPRQLRAAPRGLRRALHVRHTRPSIDGLSGRAVGEVFRLELTRNHLNAGDVMLALHRWQQFVRSPDLRMWDECDRGSVHWYCCGNPLEGRRLLDAVVQALSPRSARELRAVIDKSDALAVRSAATAALLLAPGPGNV